MDVNTVPPLLSVHWKLILDQTVPTKNEFGTHAIRAFKLTVDPVQTNVLEAVKSIVGEAGGTKDKFPFSSK